jgi:hypothetical protein
LKFQLRTWIEQLYFMILYLTSHLKEKESPLTIVNGQIDIHQLKTKNNESIIRNIIFDNFFELFFANSSRDE